VSFAIADNVLVALAVGAVLLHVLADAISLHALVAILIVLGGLMVGLIVYWFLKRIQPLQRKIAALREEP
jgi:hypothetical protein